MRGSPDFKSRARPNAQKLTQISTYKNSKLLQKQKRGGSSLASYQDRELLKKWSHKKSSFQAANIEVVSNKNRADYNL